MKPDQDSKINQGYPWNMWGYGIAATLSIFYFILLDSYLIYLSHSYVYISLWNMDNVNLFPVEITVHQWPAVPMQFLIDCCLKF